MSTTAEHHEDQARAHLAALERHVASASHPVDMERLAIRAQMATAHATLAVSLRLRDGIG